MLCAKARNCLSKNKNENTVLPKCDFLAPNCKFSPIYFHQKTPSDKHCRDFTDNLLDAYYADG